MKYSYKKRLLSRLLIASAVLTAHLTLQTQVYAETGSVGTEQIDTQNISPSEKSGNTLDTAEIGADQKDGQSEEVKEEAPIENKQESPTTDSKEEKPLEKNESETKQPEVSTDLQPEVPALESEQKNLVQEDVIALKPETIYMTEKAILSDRVELSTEVNVEGMVWTLDGKPLEEWKTQAVVDRKYVEGNFISISGSRDEANAYQIEVSLNELFGVDPSQRTPKNIRRTYRHYIGEHELIGTTVDGKAVLKKVLTFRPYASYRTHEEMLAEIEETRQQAAPNRYVTIDEIGRSAENRPIKMGIVAKDQESISTYLRDTTPKMLLQPDQMLAALEKGEFSYKLPVLINNTHADEQPGIDVITSLFKEFSTKDEIRFASKDATDQATEVTLNVKTLLDKFIFLFNFTENPDGDVKNLRTLPNGLDPNRDAGYQVNPETRAIVAQINKWNPISVLDVHGFVKEFLIEPATPPHDPNFEYDLFSAFMLENAHAMGRAGVTNSKYDSYVIPKIHWGSGWDDSFSGYTGVYAIYHGMLGHTIEIPELNEESFKAGYYAVLGSLGYLSEHPDELMKARLKFYSRGINKVEDPAAETELVGPDGNKVGRRKGNQPKFFPDYYVIPMSLDKENDLGQAFEMIEYFKRNGVQVHELTEDVSGFKKGDLVVDMAQAKRGFANHILYAGSNESAWSEMYAEVVVNFPQMRGFKSKAVFDANLFEGKLGQVMHQKAPRTLTIDHKAPFHVFANTSSDAVRAVNFALNQGKKVYLTEDGYIVDTSTFSQLVGNYALHGEALYKKPQGDSLRPLKLYIPSHSYSWAGDFAVMADSALAMKALGFELVATPEEADAIILESKQFDKSVFGKKPVVVVGGTAMKQLEKLGVLAEFDAQEFKGGSSYEGLMNAIIDDRDPLTSGYAAQGLFYSNSGNWIASLPAGFRQLVTIALDNHYIAGWWPGYEQLAGKIVAAAGEFEGQPMMIYAGNPTNKLHSVHFFRWVSNALFGSKLVSLADLPDLTPPIDVTPPNQPGKNPQIPGKVDMNTSGWTNLVNVPKEVKDTTMKLAATQTPTNESKATRLPSTNSKHSSLAGLGALLMSFGISLFYRKKKHDHTS